MWRSLVYNNLEDLFGDVVGKARRGQELSMKYVTDALDIELDDWKKLERYEWIPEKSTIARIGGFLGLDIRKLQVCAKGGFFPLKPSGDSFSGLKVEMIRLYEDLNQQMDTMSMNGFLLICSNTQKAAFIDPGFEFRKIMGFIEKSNVILEKIFLTHGHYDHFTALRDLVQETGAEVYVSKKDAPMLSDEVNLVSEKLEGNERIKIGEIDLRVAETNGHTPGGVSFIGQGFAFVGDALFAGSIGGTRKKESFNIQKSAVEYNILSLLDNTVLFPGHGPATTVGEERKNNPFYFFS